MARTDPLKLAYLARNSHPPSNLFLRACLELRAMPRLLDDLPTVSKDGTIPIRQFSLEVVQELLKPKAAVYFLIYMDEVIYIGKSVNILVRISTGHLDKKYDRVLYLEYPKEKLEAEEKYWIKVFNPINNITYTPKQKIHRGKAARSTRIRAAREQLEERIRNQSVLFVNAKLAAHAKTGTTLY